MKVVSFVQVWQLHCPDYMMLDVHLLPFVSLSVCPLVVVGWLGVGVRLPTLS